MKKKRALPTPETIAIGKRLATARNLKKLTLEDVADQMNVSPSLVGQFEKGRAGLTAKRIHQLMNILEVNMNYILTGDDPEEKNKAHTQIEKEVLDLIRTLDPETQTIFLKNIKELANAFIKLTKK